jgi:hypothetical protein
LRAKRSNPGARYWIASSGRRPPRNGDYPVLDGTSRRSAPQEQRGRARDLERERRNASLFRARSTVEGFWSLIKRGAVGTLHEVNPKYLPLYVAEFCFRYNNRENDDIFGEAILGC